MLISTPSRAKPSRAEPSRAEPSGAERSRAEPNFWPNFCFLKKEFGFFFEKKLKKILPQKFGPKILPKKFGPNFLPQKFPIELVRTGCRAEPWDQSRAEPSRLQHYGIVLNCFRFIFVVISASSSLRCCFRRHRRLIDRSKNLSRKDFQCYVVKNP